jgi:hypothetical protein
MGEFLFEAVWAILSEMAVFGFNLKPLYNGENKWKRISPCIVGIISAITCFAAIKDMLSFMVFFVCLGSFFALIVLRFFSALISGKYKLRKN